MKSTAILYFKNLLAPKSQKRLLAFCFDDYGNVRIHSREAREYLDRQGLPHYARFDTFDALETRHDLEILFDTLSSVNDVKGNPARLTALATIANPDFEQIAKDNYQNYHYELLPVTFDRLGADYGGCMPLWYEGIAKQIIKPEFHGREHLNLRVLMAKLHRREADVMACISQQSLTSLKPLESSNASWTAAFEFDDPREWKEHRHIIKDGVHCFEQVFGGKPTVFNPPGGTEHRSLHPFLKELGFKVIETQFFHWAHQGNGKYRPRFHHMKAATSRSPAISVRNCVFEPTANQSIDWVAKTIKQVDVAFRLNRPAIISSHRVNYSGRICERNREIGIVALRSLLQSIVAKWPDVEFLFLDELCDQLGLTREA